MDPIQAAIQAAANQAAKQGPNLNESVKGGGNFPRWKPPVEGVALARFVGYVETGIHKNKYKNNGVDQIKEENMATFTFELSGAKYPHIEFQGEMIPHRVSFEINISQNEKARYFKLFQLMKQGVPDAVNFGQLLGQPYLVTVIHEKWGEMVDVLDDDGKPVLGSDGQPVKEHKFCKAVIYDKKAGAFTVRPAVNVDPVAGTSAPIPVPEPVTTLSCFFWDFPSQPLWDSLYIPGEYPARTDKDGKVVSPARSKNVYQDKIRRAVNFPGSPIADLLGGAEALVGPADTPALPERKAEDQQAAEQSQQLAAQGVQAQPEADPLADIPY